MLSTHFAKTVLYFKYLLLIFQFQAGGTTQRDYGDVCIFYQYIFSRKYPLTYQVKLMVNNIMSNTIDYIHVIYIHTVDTTVFSFCMTKILTRTLWFIINTFKLAFNLTRTICDSINMVIALLLSTSIFCRWFDLAPVDLWIFIKLDWTIYQLLMWNR